MILVMKVFERNGEDETLMLERVITTDEKETNVILQAIEAAQDDRADLIDDPAFALQIDACDSSSEHVLFGAGRVHKLAADRVLECLAYARIHKDTKQIALALDARVSLH